MALRVALGGIAHETSSYCPRPTTIDDFAVCRGDEIVSVNRGVRSALGGMLEGSRELGADVVGLLHADAQPAGLIDGSGYQLLRASLLERLRGAGPVDAVCLALHGAGLIDGIGELERDLVGAVRAQVGARAKLLVTLDLHANNVTDDLVELADLVFGCHRYPHTDFFDRGREVARHLPALLEETLVPVGHVERLPMIIAATTTDEGPAAEAAALCESIALEPGVLDCTFFHGFMHTDWPTVGACVVAYADRSGESARDAARRAAEWVWSHRDRFNPHVPTATEAIARARAAAPGLVILHEMSDNPGGGAPGDGTHLLRAMVAAELEDACFAVLADPEAVDAAHRAGVGATLPLRLGGKTDHLHGAPIDADVYVKCLTDGRFTVRSPMGGGRSADLGRMARICIGGIDVLLASRRAQVFDPAVIELNGIDPRRCRYLALKSEHHFRAGFAGLWSAAIPVDGPGLSSVDFARLPRAHTPRPIWPLDPEARLQGMRPDAETPPTP
jgi:microcystin degradation protein MlrC